MPTWHDTAAAPAVTCRVGTEGAIETNVAPTLLGSPWVPQVSGVSVTLYGVAWNGFRFMAVGENGTGLTSEDGVTWAPITMGVATDLFAITAGGNVFITVGAGGVILTSQNGIEWSAIVSGTTYDLWDVTTANAEYIAVGDNDVIVVGPITSTLLDIIMVPTVAVTSTAQAQAIFSETLTESVGINDVPSRATFAPVPILVAVTEHLGMEDQGATSVGGVVETGFSETSTSLDVVVGETLLMDEVGAGAYQGDTAQLFFMYLNDEAGMSSVQSADQLVGNALSADAVAVNDRPFINNELLTDGIGLGDILSAYFHLHLIENMGVTGTLDSVALFDSELVEALVLDDTATLNGAFQITVLDEVGLADATSVGQILNILISERVSFAISVEINGELYYAWVVNTETLDTTQYSNYGFESFCELDGEYFATDGASIYRLSGDDDAGAAIDAEISLGATDFGSAFQKGVQDVFFGFASDGKLLLKVVTDEQVENWYELDDTEGGVHGAKLKVGRGLKARYWRFKVRNVKGSDFELDSIRMVPVSTGRRV